MIDAVKARVGTRIKQKWLADALLGVGGMGAVYAATHRNGNRVALKILHTQLSIDGDIRARFGREGYVANSVSHPGVVRVLDDDETEDGAAFLVMELLEGENAEARATRSGGRLPVDEVARLGADLLDVLAAAHAASVVHRDIKPENIFFTKHGELKVLDFGIARLRDGLDPASHTRTGVTMETPSFITGTLAAPSLRIEGNTVIEANRIVRLRAAESHGIIFVGGKINGTTSAPVVTELGQTEQVGDGLGLFSGSGDVRIENVSLTANARASGLIDSGRGSSSSSAAGSKPARRA